MPISTANGVPVYYEVHGKGFPVLMITGMASVMDWFHYTIPAFVEAGFQVIAQDLRGSNRDGITAPLRPYSTEDMARDSIGILDDLGIERAHIFGMSMGGIVSQVIAVRHSERVERLIISANGLARMPEDVKKMALGQVDDGSPISEMHSRKASREEQLASSIKLAFTPDIASYHPERLQFFKDVIFTRHGPLDVTRKAQVIAACEHDFLDELANIKARTLLIVGELDHVNGGQIGEMANRIPDNECRILPGMAHGFVLEHADEINEITLTFLKRP
ncbi:MAG: alpha/beta hydrolase [Sphingomonadales bacterium]|nr:alpha/beta hydrolase [Sphingomonadales bacterium]